MQQDQMTTISFSQSYELIWQVSFAPNYQITQHGKIFNMQRGKELKKVLNGYSIGYWIDGKFWTLENLRKCLVKIPEKEFCPF